MVLASPAFNVKLYVPFARAGLRLMRKLRGNFFVKSYVKAKFLTARSCTDCRCSSARRAASSTRMPSGC